MKGFTAVLLIWTLTSPGSSGSSNSGYGDGRREAWPTHLACREGGLEVLYQSCDPLQDFGFSMDQCSKQLKSNLNIRFGIILREDIKELFLDIALTAKGSSILNFSYPICEEDQPKFSFCGRRKGGTSWLTSRNERPTAQQFQIAVCDTCIKESQTNTSHLKRWSHLQPV
ncbi:lymphocyte antigen 86 isoform X2 [Lemur catta]|uniref:lymphocyte antigen 86 isoform X2 n=1 Tax=Lemur catta TaxID=9447 RepID=UPI001E269C55|nr:lymphocyte antigen 86 isoform X2 [Lemur catta]